MDTTTTYLGLKLAHPIVPGAGPLTADLDTLRQLEDAGAPAAVLHSLFEEQIRHEDEELAHHLEHTSETHAEALQYFPQAHEFRLGPQEYLEHVRRAKEATRIPIIASLNGVTTGGWTDYAKQIQQAGADALELNVYYIATDPNLTAAEVEQRYVEILQAVKSAVTIPVAVKLGPYFSALASMARRLTEAGADGLVLFNRFYQPDLDLERLEVVPNLVLSAPYELRLPLRWIAILYGRIQASLAATSGIANGTDVLRALMAGADVAQVCSILLRKGPGELRALVDQMKRWMEEHEYESVTQLKGSLSQKSCPDPAAFERANYMKTLNSYR